MRRLAAPVLSILVTFTAAAAAVAEDVLVLQNGREIRGRIVSESDDRVKIDIGGGTMTFKRAQIAEVKREGAALPDAPAAPVSPDGEPSRSREEFSILYRDGERAGTRTVRTRRDDEGFVFEEELVFLDAKGARGREVRTIERCDLQFRPVSFQLRESAALEGGKTTHRTLSGEFRSGRLFLQNAVDGDRTKWDESVPGEPRMRFAAREFFLRESKALSGALDAKVYDPAARRWTDVTYQEGGLKKVRLSDRMGEVRVVLRKRGATVEAEWIDGGLSTWSADIDGAALRAVASNAAAVARVREGDTDADVGPASAGRTRYADKLRGFSLSKPDPSWTFESPEQKSGGGLVVVRNEAAFATVDVMLDTAARADTTLERAVESLQRTCRLVCPDFKVERDGFVERAGRRVYWMEATATTKSEKTRTLARIAISPDLKVYRLLAACPEAGFDAMKPDFEKILDSFTFE